MTKSHRAAGPQDMLKQVAALPYRRTEKGGVEILVLTSRETHRFVIPKGWPMKGKSPSRAAAVEAKQEAGVLGKIASKPAGSYRYFKRLADSFALVEVTVFPLLVEKTRKSWREQSERVQRWLRPEDAARLIDEGDLAELIREFARS